MAISDSASDAGRGRSGELRVSWVSRAAPWLKYRVLVDGFERGRIGSGKPALIKVEPGEHRVVVRHWSFATRPRRVKVDAAEPLELYSGVRTVPRWLGFRENWRWSKANSIWLNDAAVTPPIEHHVEPRSIRPYRWMFQILSIVFWFFVALVAGAGGHYARMTIGIAFAVVGFSILASWRRMQASTDVDEPERTSSPGGRDTASGDAAG